MSNLYGLSNIRLKCTPRSPFARRIRSYLIHQDLAAAIDSVDIFNPNAELIRSNPLGLVPVVEADLHGKPIRLFDSDTILEFFDDLGAKVYSTPNHSVERVHERQWSRIATGAMTCTVQIVLEKMRPLPSSTFIDEEKEVIVRCLERLHEDSAELLFVKQNYRTLMDWGILLQYLDLRLPDLEWRKRFPFLLPILEACMPVRGFKETEPPAAV